LLLLVVVAMWLQMMLSQVYASSVISCKVEFMSSGCLASKQPLGRAAGHMHGAAGGPFRQGHKPPPQFCATPLL